MKSPFYFHLRLNIHNNRRLPYNTLIVNENIVAPSIDFSCLTIFLVKKHRDTEARRKNESRIKRIRRIARINTKNIRFIRVICIIRDIRDLKISPCLCASVF